MSKLPEEKVAHPAYNHRDAPTLTKLPESNKELQLASNAILHPDFCDRDSESLYDIALLVGESWITDVFCPTIEAAIRLHVAKELVVNYRVDPSKYAELCDEICSKISYKDEIKKEIDEQKKVEGSAFHCDTLKNKAVNRLARNKVAISEDTIQAAIDIESDVAKRDLIDEKLRPFVSAEVEKYMNDHDTARKPSFQVGKNHDYCFLGAAGSGKSTVARQVTESKTSGVENILKDYIILSTDNFRLFTPDDVEGPQFVRTQDFAYLVKTLVRNEIEMQIEENEKRPNIQCDAKTMEKFMHEMIGQGTNVTSVFVAYAPAGHVGIAERADYRARHSEDLSEKGRFVNTDSLFQDHADASARLLLGIPQHVTTKLYDTDVERGERAIQIGEIDPPEGTMRIGNLRKVASFLNKKNINQDACSPVEALLSPKGGYTTAPERKASAVMDIVSEHGYSVELQSGEITYAKLVKEESGFVRLDIKDPSVWNDKIKGKTIEAGLLKEIEDQSSMKFQKNKQKNKVIAQEVDELRDTMKRLGHKGTKTASINEKPLQKQTLKDYR